MAAAAGYICFKVVPCKSKKYTVMPEPEISDLVRRETDRRHREQFRKTQRARLVSMIEACRLFKETMNDIRKLQDISNIINLNSREKAEIRSGIDSVLEKETELAAETFLEKLHHHSTPCGPVSFDTKSLQRKIDSVSECTMESHFREEIAGLLPIFSIEEALESSKWSDSSDSDEMIAGETNLKRRRNSEKAEAASNKRHNTFH
jgi:hypothetical protein